MENQTLHTRIREQGGAYGSGAVNGALSGQFYFYAYRDPHIKTTLEAFKDAIHGIVEGAFEPEHIEEAKLGLFQDMDSPIPPGGRAMTAYSRIRGGRTQERRQAFRDRLLNCEKAEIQQAAQEVLLKGFEKAVTVAFAGKELLEKENVLPIFPVDFTQ